MTIASARWKYLSEQVESARVRLHAVTHRKNHPAKTSPRGTKVPFAKKKHRLVRRMARGALLAASFTAVQFFSEDTTESKRLFDHRVVDTLREPLTHYHE